MTTQPPEVAIVAATLRIAAEWFSGEQRDMLRETADDTERGWASGGTCPVCEEMTCDEGCPLEHVRAALDAPPNTPNHQEPTVQPTIGRIVHYTLTAADADAINKRRADFTAFRQTLTGPIDPGHRGASGHVAHVGNHATAGDTYPAMIVRTFDGHAANLQVHLDGTDTYWATSRTEGDGDGFWAWPPRV